MTSEPWRLSAVEQAAAIRCGDLSAEEIMASVLQRIEAVDHRLGAYCTTSDSALADARRADEKRRLGGHLGPLHGVPFSVKDLLPTRGLRTTLGSLAHRSWVPEVDEIAVARMKEAGAILIGKTNTRELGYGVVTDNELFGPTRSPWDPRMTAGGSSGGAAAAVASGMGSIALGSDGGGSIRVPAALCGVFGIKPTFGAVPLYPSCRAPLRLGLDSWGTLQSIGPLSRTVHDSALALSAIAGFDRRDRSSAPFTLSLRLPEADRVESLKIAFSPDLGIAEVVGEVAELARQAVSALARARGLDIAEVGPELPCLSELRETFAASVAADTNLEDLKALSEQVKVSPDITEILARSWGASDFTRARVERQKLHESMHGFFDEIDILITPTTAAAAFPVGQRWPVDGIADGRQWSPFAFIANLTGQPAANIPVGLTHAGLPVGIQVMSKKFDDMKLLDVAHAFELTRPSPQRPDI